MNQSNPEPKFVVAPNKSVMAPMPGKSFESRGKRRQLTEGVTIPAGSFCDEDLKSLIRSGYVIPIGQLASARSQAPRMVELAGRQVTQISRELKDGEKAQRSQARQKWAMDPSNLQDLDLNQLYTLVLERDPTFPAEETLRTVDDAVRFLSAEFKPDEVDLLFEERAAEEAALRDPDALTSEEEEILGHGSDEGEENELVATAGDLEIDDDENDDR